MTTRLVVFALASLVPAAAAAQHFHHHVEAAPGAKSVCAKTYATPALDPRLPKVPWEVITDNPVAKQHFQQGMALYYGFNYEDALRNFKKATELAPSFVMGWWGMAMAAGPNINFTKIDDDCLVLARSSSGEAWRLGQKLSPKTVDYQLAEALPVRYAGSDPKKRTDEYADAMSKVWASFAAGLDPNVGALYAESLMDKWPWDLWTPDHKEKHADTAVVLKVLREVTDRHADALGAHHYFIHAVEAGPTPEEARDSAKFLKDVAGSAGHLAHMPSHTYLLMGDYEGAVEANDKAVEADRGFDGPCKGNYDEYIANPECPQLYYGHYYVHNLFFRAVAEAFRGRVDKAIGDAGSAYQHAIRFLPNEPGLQRYMAPLYLILAAHGRWDPIVKASEPECTPPLPIKYDSGCHIARSIWHWAKGMAYTTAPKDLVEARTEFRKFLFERGQIRPPTPTGWSNNTAEDVLAVAADTLAARIAWAEGSRELAIEKLKLAVAHEDALIYDEPPQWVFPVRQSLGGAYLAMGRYQEAIDSFQADLLRHPKNGRSLYGIASAYTKWGKPTEAKPYWEGYETAWKGADRPLSEEALWLLGMTAAPASSGESPPAPGR